QVLELAEAPAARVEVGREPDEVAADRAQLRPAAVVGRRVHRLAQQRVELAVALERLLLRLPARAGLAARGLFFLLVDAQVLGVDELVAGGDEGLRGLTLAEAVDGEPLLADARGQAGEVAVAGDDAEAVEVAAVHQVHRVDDQRAVRGVLAGGVVELLDRGDRVGQQPVLPAAEVPRGPVAVGAAHAGVAVLGDLRQQRRQVLRVAVVGVDQDREPRGVGHGILRRVGSMLPVAPDPWSGGDRLKPTMGRLYYSGTSRSSFPSAASVSTYTSPPSPTRTSRMRSPRSCSRRSSATIA